MPSVTAWYDDRENLRNLLVWMSRQGPTGLDTACALLRDPQSFARAWRQYLEWCESGKEPALMPDPSDGSPEDVPLYPGVPGRSLPPRERFHEEEDTKP
jgi:hypothetical protein